MGSDDSPSSASQTRKALVGTIWITSSSYLRYALNVVTGIFLARLLLPSEFGVFNLAVSLNAMLAMLTAWGVGAAVVSRPKLDERFKRGALTLMLILSIVVIVLTGLVAYAWRRTEPLAALFLIVLGGLQGILNISMMPMLLLERDLKFRPVAIIRIASVAAEGAISILFALLDFGAWALLIGRIFGSVLHSVLFWMNSPWRPRLGLDYELLRWFYQYGRNFFISQNLQTIQSRFDDLIVGTLTGKAALGFYSKSFLLSESVAQIIAPGIGSVMLPTFRSVREDVQTIKDLFDDMTWAVIRLMLAYTGVVAIAAPELVSIVFGERWLPMVPILRMLLIYSALLPLYRIVRSLIIALGLESQLARVHLFQTAFFIPTVIIVTFLLTPVWTALVVATSTLITVIWLMQIVHKRIPVKTVEILPVPLFSFGLGAGVAWWVKFHWLDTMSTFPTTLIVAAVFFGLYGLLLWGLEPALFIKNIRRVLELLKIKERLEAIFATRS